MKLKSSRWTSLFLGVFLLAVLVGVAGARSNAGPDAAAAPLNVITVPASACIPDGATDWAHFKEYVTCYPPPCSFVCHFNFPAEGPGTTVSAEVKKLEAYVYDIDSHAGGDITIYLYKTDPKTATSTEMAKVKSSGGSATDPRVLVDKTISSNPIRNDNGQHIWLYFNGGDIKFYGAQVFYKTP